MRNERVHAILLSLAVGAGLAASASRARAAGEPPTVPPAELSRVVASKDKKPVILQVGFRKLYEQAHIPGSRYAGPGSSEEGLALLRRAVEKLPHATPIVLYCGCCPWVRCPNVHPAYRALRDMGFTDVKVLYVADNFGADWVARGYPVEKGAPPHE